MIKQRTSFDAMRLLAHKDVKMPDNNGKDIFTELTQVVGTSASGLQIDFPPFEPNHVTIAVKKRMRRDPQIRLGLSIIKAPILGLPLQVTSKDADIALFVEAALKPIWRSILRSSLNAVDFGHVPHEKVYALDDVIIMDADGKEKRFPNSIVYHKIKDLDPDDVVYLRDENGDFAGFQWMSDVIVPAEKSFVMVQEKEFGNPYGRSRLDSVYEPWYWGGIMFTYTNRYFERRATPTIKGRSPTKFKDGVKTVDKTFGDTLVELKTESVINMPSEQTNGIYNYDCEYLLDDKRGEMFQDYIDRLQALKLRGLLVPERVVTQDSSVGSLAMVESMTDTFMKMEEQLVADVYEHVNKFIIPPLVKFRFGEKAPKAVAIPGNLTEKNVQLIKDVIFKVIDAETVIGTEKPYRTFDIIDSLSALENLGMPVKIPEKKIENPISVFSNKPSTIELAKEILDSPVTLKDVDKFARDAMGEFAKSLEAERTVIETPIRKHNMNVVKAILKNLKGAKFNKNRLAKKGNESVLRKMLKDINELHNKFLQSMDIEEKNIVKNYLKKSQKLAQRHYKQMMGIVKGQLARRRTPGVRLPPAGSPSFLDAAILDNEFGIQQNIENIALREDRSVSESLINAFDNERILFEIDFPLPDMTPGLIILEIDKILEELDLKNFAIDKTSGLLAEIKNFRFNKSFTASTVDAHYHAVYRRTLIELAMRDGINVFKAFRTEVEDSKESACAKFDGKIGTLDWWDVQAERLGAGGGIRQFGLHRGCKTKFYPIQVELIAKENIKVETLQDT